MAKEGIVSASLFDDCDTGPPRDEELQSGVVLLHGFALREASTILQAVETAAAAAPFRQMLTPNGFQMSVAMTSCGAVGWISDRSGYRYDALDPQSGRPWPSLPLSLSQLATSAASRAGFNDFHPDVCLINRYAPGTKLSLHQDKDERDFSQPIVSASFGLPVGFQLGGDRRSDHTQRVPLVHGDVLVWGGPARLYYHGVLTLKPGDHPAVGPYRVNLTFRRAR